MGGRIEICPDLYGVQAIKPRELNTTVIEIDRLAEIIADEPSEAEQSLAAIA